MSVTWWLGSIGARVSNFDTEIIMLRIVQGDLLSIQVPFRAKLKHAPYPQDYSGSVVVRLYSQDGQVGYGEGLPRVRVTGESIKSTRDTIHGTFMPLLLGRSFRSWDDAVDYAQVLETKARATSAKLPARVGSARCAVELALLDLAGKTFGRCVSDIFGQRKRTVVQYGTSVNGKNTITLGASALRERVSGFRNVKIDVGHPNDVKRLRLVRRLLGTGVDIRLDANGAWDAREAVRNIQELKRCTISAVEQPVPADDLEGMAQVTNAVSTPIMADESLCSLEDAQTLIRLGACDMFNIQISKCGGILGAIEVAQLAMRHGISCQLGCQTGETAILSAAGRHFALGVVGLKYVEGSYGHHLLRRDISDPDVTFGRAGKAGLIDGPGLGINVIQNHLTSCVVDQAVIRE